MEGGGPVQVNPMDVRLETLEDGRLHVLGAGAYGIVRYLRLPRVLVSTPVCLELSWGHGAPADLRFCNCSRHRSSTAAPCQAGLVVSLGNPCGDGHTINLVWLSQAAGCRDVTT